MMVIHLKRRMICLCCIGSSTFMGFAYPAAEKLLWVKIKKDFSQRLLSYRFCVFMQNFPDFPRQSFHGEGLLNIVYPFIQNAMMHNGIFCIA